MRAWRVHELGEPLDVMRLDDVEPVSPGQGELAIEVAACALNFPDVLLCRGQYQVKPPLPFTPGLEASGRVVAVGDDVSGVREGERVIVLPTSPRGALSTRVLARPDEVYPIPESIDDSDAAALPITYQTGWFGLHHRARLQKGETLLVHGGAGGIGSAAIQLGLAAGAVVIATAGGPGKADVCRRLGADVVIDYLTEDFVDVVREVTDGRGADVVFDPVGGDVFDRSRRCVAWEGRIVTVGFTSGRVPEAPVNHVLMKNYSVVGIHWGPYRDRTPNLVRQCHDELLRLYADGSIRPLVTAKPSFEHAPEALRLLADRTSCGKIVVQIEDGR